MFKKPRYRRGAVIATITLLTLFGPFSQGWAQHMQMTPVLGAYFKMVFAGDVSGATALFAAEPDDNGSKMLAERFERRFAQRSDSLDLSAIESAVVREIAELFQAYWRDALMQKAPLDALEQALVSRLDELLINREFTSSLDNIDKLSENVEALIREEGYFAQSGRTPPLLDLMIWTRNEVATESVVLTDATYEVEVNYLDDPISYGWSNFAAFGMTSTGGWAKEDGLYCFCRHYDLDSERFKLSFLKHETRHFADFKLYPELQPSDLEYRGKLTELAFSEERTYRLVEQFQNSANRIENAPHPLANWYVIEGMSAQLLDGEWPAEASAWQSVPKEQIRQAARSLLEEHDGMLADLGSASAKGVINF
jgi:hypothetical protein